ncbi:type I DNA topoisomerase [bacterium]|nr:MAG: type I DNA topoisomerase [bacterium]
MSKKLIIVESPTKSRTLKRFLGDEYDILASGGHLVDLPPDRLAVDIDNGFIPQYEPIEGKKKTISMLRTSARKAEQVFLASDPDREGEAIAWHISKIIDKKNGNVGRVLFNEITKSAVLKGLENPREIDIRKVDAQQARRVLDRLVGYLVSPLLWKTLYKGLSAGRVQSVALRLICEREEKIEAFVPVEYWHIHAELEFKKVTFNAKVIKFDGENLEIPDEKTATYHKTELEKLEYTVADIEEKTIIKNPYPPFITSTMQLVAARQLGLSAKRTMQIAQQLYEGIELGEEGPSGLITYMRTDSVRVAKEAQAAAAEFIEKKFGKDYLKIRSYKSGKASQDAHEAIRPTDVFRTPESVKKYLSGEQYSLYELIWQRFMASMMAPALYNQKKATINAGQYELSATETVLTFDGYLKAMPEKNEDENESAKLPKLEPRNKCNLVSLEPSQHFTKPPPRFSEGTLVKELEENGIGRPSTYAQIINTLFARKYINREKKRLVPTPLGREVYRLLIKLFPGLFEVGFTADMEQKLDKVEEGKFDWVEVVSKFYEDFEPMLQTANKNRNKIKKTLEKKTKYICEKCGSPMIIKWGRHGKFLACSNFPECKNTKPIDEKGRPVNQEIEGKKCPECGKPLVIKHDRRGRRFIACTGYPKCRYTEPFDTGYPCPKEGCDGHIQERWTRKNKVFFGCSNYPECDFASWDPPVEGPCPECGCKTMFLNVRKKGTTKICVRCGYSEPVESS